MVVTTLYRIFGEKHSLLYVGVSDDLDSRLRTHSLRAWWPDVRAIETKEYATRTEAEAAEVAAIKSECPLHNRTHSTSPPDSSPIPTPRRRGQRRELISINAAADYLSVCPKTIRRRISDGSLTAYRMGKRLIRVDVAELDTMLRPIPTAGVR